VIAGRPLGALEIPAAVQQVAAGRSVRAVWENELGGLTFEVGAGPGRWFVKWAPAGSSISLAKEAQRLGWAGQWTPVPQLLDQGSDAAGSWIVTAGLDGDSAVSQRWKADPATAVTAIGAGLRALHDTLPVEPCPFSWSTGERVADAGRRVASREVDPRRWHPDHHHLGVEEALELIADVPPVDELVVCHGDACAPNTIVGHDGSCVGHVDLGALGVADRWADLAVATWSTQWNYGPGWDDRLLAAYGIEADAERTRYYRLLWDLGP
jgi:kanamycin kinase